MVCIFSIYNVEEKAVWGYYTYMSDVFKVYF